MESDKISKQHKSNTKDCKCFMCTNKNSPEILYGYLKGQIDTSIGCITHDTLEECVLEMLYHAISYGRITVAELRKAGI